ncbi:SpoIIE family protein phosphatase [Streptomyces sp. NPDC006372]|uniref:SpoIIE family protein phosphatase n=1 Tax=Streptomyces sp. NPDC006372 TaxID=3155599 RepID=UPI0033AD6335
MSPAGDAAAVPRGSLDDDALPAHATVDERGVVTGWSEQARRLLGYAPAEVEGRPAADLLAEDAREAAATRGHRVRQSGGWSGQVTVRHRDGGRMVVALSAVPLSGSKGRGQWILTVSGTPQPAPRPTEAELLEWVFDQSPCPMAVCDRERRLIRANRAMERMTRQSSDEMRGRRAVDITPGSPRARAVDQDMERAMSTGTTVEHESIVQAPDQNRPRVWTITSSPLKDPTGRTQGVFGQIFDVTGHYMVRQRLTVLNEASKRIGTSLDVNRTAQELADTAVPGLADFVSVDLVESVSRGEEPTVGSVGAAHWADTTIALFRSAQSSVLEGCPESAVEPGHTGRYPAYSPPALGLATGRPARYGVEDTEISRWLDASPKRAASVKEQGIHSVMIVPLLARGITLGVALFLRHQRPFPFDDDDLLLAEEICARAAVCIDNARRYTGERATALALQRSLLPRNVPEQAGVEVASRYLPTDSRAGVGGDWFDVIPLSGTRVALVVGDVVGHGVQAAAAMGRLRSAVRTLADVDLPPDELLTHLDDLVAHTDSDEDAVPGDSATGFGATCLYAVYDPVSRHCTLARAGHPVPALVLPDGTARYLDLPAGPPLGLGGMPFESVEIELAEGSLLALYTDGLIESRGRDPDASRAQLLRILAAPSSQSIGLTCDTLLKALLPERPTDDVALLVVRTRCLSAGQVASWDLPADPAIVAEARKAASDQLARWGLEESTFVTELVVSELVTNAIRHAEPPIRLRLINDRNLICEVSDASSTAPHLRRARVFDEGGRGLLLVAQLTQGWGARQTTTGKTIWAEQALPARPP